MNYLWKCSLWNASHLVQASICSLSFMFNVDVLQAVPFLTETCRDCSNFYMAMCTANYRRCTNTKHWAWDQVDLQRKPVKITPDSSVLWPTVSTSRPIPPLHHVTTIGACFETFETTVNRTWDPGIILGICLAYERRRYHVTSSPIGWAHI